MTATIAALGCIDCGCVQSAQVPPDRGECLTCRDCGADLERTTWRTVETAFAFAAATFLLLWPANLLPLMRTSLLGHSQEGLIASGVADFLGDGWPEIALIVALFSVVLPLVRFGLLSLVLGLLVARRRPAWLGRAFRYANLLQSWAMIEVFGVAFLIAYFRLRASVEATIQPGGACLLAAGVLALLTRAALDKAAVWRAIAPDATPGGGGAPMLCPECDLVVAATDAGGHCPRCAVRLDRRLPEGTSRAFALVTAGALLYIPANLYPLAMLPIGGRPQEYTILQGVIDLADAKLVGLAAIVFVASFAIPLLKLTSLGWCIHSVATGARAHLRAKTTAYRFVEEIGRWSMLDPFVIACFVPVMQYNAFATARAEPAVPFFTGVVVLTMLASRAFDPRRMWDMAGARA